MLKIGFNIKSAIYAVLRNLIIVCMLLSVYSTITQSAELTLDVTTPSELFVVESDVMKSFP